MEKTRKYCHRAYIKKCILVNNLVLALKPISDFWPRKLIFFNLNCFLCHNLLKILKFFLQCLTKLMQSPIRNWGPFPPFIYPLTHSLIHLLCYLSNARFGHWKLLQIDSMPFYISITWWKYVLPLQSLPCQANVILISVNQIFIYLVASQDYIWNWYSLKK